MSPGIFPPIRDAEKVAPRMVFMDNPSEEEFKKLMTGNIPRNFLCQIAFCLLTQYESKSGAGRQVVGSLFFDVENLRERSP